MAYDDYGGYAYRNGVLMPECSDVEIRDNMFHISLGDDEIKIGLYKQMSAQIHRGSTITGLYAVVNIYDLIKDKHPTFFIEWQGQRIFDPDWIVDRPPIVFDLDDNEISIGVVYSEFSNFITFARIKQPDGIVWTGFSGYGIGLGFEDGRYDTDTAAVADHMKEYWERTWQKEGQ